jgi:preprotein translocase subunit YajC
MWISPAYAQADGGGESGLISLLPLVLIFVVFYFLLIRPQQKKMKAHRSMVEALKRGDRVATGGGLLGTVTKVVGDNEVQVEIAEGVRVKVLRHTIQEVMSKGESAGKGKAGEPGAKPANDDGKAAKGGFDLGKLLGLGRPQK